MKSCKYTLLALLATMLTACLLMPLPLSAKTAKAGLAKAGLAKACPAEDSLARDSTADEAIADSLLLKGVEVRGTRIRMVSRGDTIVYDALAFPQSEGNALRDLISQLPGVTIGKDGVVRVGGKAVDYLTLNGRDFFKGKNNVMLDNLPAYTVSKVNVYHKSTARSRYMGHDVEDKDYVMDVQLKRQFLQGASGSVEAGAGTERRRIARLFALAYTSRSRLSVYGNANNINEMGSEASDDYQAPSATASPTDMKTAGLDFNTGNKDESFKYSLSSEFTRTDNHQYGTTAGERFLSTGNVFNNSVYDTRNRNFSFNVNNSFELSRPLYLALSTFVSYNRNRSTGLNRTATFSGDPSAAGSADAIIDTVFSSRPGEGLLGPLLTNRTADESASLATNLWLSGNLYATRRLKSNDGINLSVSGSYGKTENNTGDLYRLDYAGGAGHTGLANSGDPSSDHRNRYDAQPSRSNSLSVRTSYDLVRFAPWTFSASASYDRSYNHSEVNRYRLDRLDGWGTADDRRPGQLPSTRDSLLLALDAANSYTSTTTRQTFEGQLSAVYMKTDSNGFTRFSLAIPVRRHTERLHYLKNATDTLLSRRYNEVQPVVMFNRYGQRGGFGFAYRGTVTPPSLASSVNTRDDSNPLAVRESNPGLRNSVTHYLSVSRDFRRNATQSMLSLSANATIIRHALAQGRTYDSRTGVYTYRPENVEGNWSAGADASYSCSPDSLRRFTLSGATNFYFDHNVDIAFTAGSQASPRSAVDNYATSQTLSVSYRLGENVVTADGRLSWRHSASRNEGFVSINAFEFNYGLAAGLRLPWHFKFNTDVRVYSRRGYSDATVNTDDIIWNLALTRLFFHDRLSLKVVCTDLLHQLNNVSYYVDGQGKTESRVNSIPHYVMVSVAYKLFRQNSR